MIGEEEKLHDPFDFESDGESIDADQEVSADSDKESEDDKTEVDEEILMNH